LIDVEMKTKGLEEVSRALENSFPKDSKQRSVLQAAMRDAGRQTALVEAKLRAAGLGGSGALAAALTYRNRSLREIKTARVFAGVELYVKRNMAIAIKRYESFYKVKVKDGIRHGHLVEFGTKRTAARPFIWPAARSTAPQYLKKLATESWKSIEKNLAKERAKQRKK